MGWVEFSETGRITSNSAPAPAAPGSFLVTTAFVNWEAMQVIQIFKSEAFLMSVTTIRFCIATVIPPHLWCSKAVHRHRAQEDSAVSSHCIRVLQRFLPSLAVIAAGYATLARLKKYRRYMSATTVSFILPSLIAFVFLPHRSRRLLQTSGRMLSITWFDVRVLRMSFPRRTSLYIQNY